MIDTHCHLEFKQFDKDREEVIDKSKEILKAVINSSASIEDSERVLDLHRLNKDFLFPSIGLHPKRAVNASNKEIEDLKGFIKNKGEEIVAIGEVGLDFAQVKDAENRNRSKRIFADFVELSDDMGLPIVVHARRAMDDTLDILDKKKGDVVIHCFAGDMDHMKTALDRGYYISLGGMVFRNQKKYERLVKELPEERLLLETDAPFLAKKKSDRSEPWFIREVARRISEMKNTDFDKIWQAAGKNAKNVFDLPIDI